MSFHKRQRALLAATFIIIFASATAIAETAPNILIWQPDYTASEIGQALLVDLGVLGEDAVLVDDLFAYTPDLSGHEIVMGVVGFTPDTHVLDLIEGSVFEAYVQNGGLLLLEAGDCFDYDPEVSDGYDVRPILGLGIGSDGSHFGSAARALTRRQEFLAACFELLRSGGQPTAVSNVAPLIALHPAAPNPFISSTTIWYDLSRDARVRVSVFDVSGRLVRTLMDRPEMQGPHSINWEGRDGSGNGVASGVYFYSLNAGGIALNRRVVVLR